MKFVKEFLKEDKGGFSENAAFIVLMLIILVGAITFLGPKIKDTVTQSGTKLDEAKDFTY